MIAGDKLTGKRRLGEAAFCLLLWGWFQTTSSYASGPPPVITLQPASQSVPYQGTVSFRVTATSGTTLSYQWYFAGKKVNNATLSSYSITNIQTTNAGVYYVQISNSGGSVNSSNATLTVILPPTITNQPQNQTVTLGQAASFSVAAGGTAPFSYQWQFNGTNLAGATNASLTLATVQSSQAGRYMVVVTNLAGLATSSNATLSVLLPPTITNQPVSQTVSLGQTASFSVGATGSSGLSYQWAFKGTNVAGATNATLTLTNAQTSQAGNYTVVVTQSSASVTSTVATLTVNLSPAFTTQPQNQTVVQGQTASFTVVMGGATTMYYVWYLNGSAVASGSGGQTYTLTLTNVQASSAGSWYVKVYNLYNLLSPVTSGNATLTVLVPPAITNQPQSQTVLTGQTALFSVAASGTAPLSYQWYFAQVLPTPAAASVRQTSLISKSKASSTITTTNSIAATNAGFTPLSGATNATLSLASFQATNSGNYLVVITNVAGSVTSSVAALTVGVAPAITTQPQNQTVAAGQDATFSVVATGTAPLSYQWNFNSAPIAGATNATFALSGVHANNAGTYAVLVTNSVGSVASVAAGLTVTNPVVVLSAGGGGMGMTPSGFTFQLSAPVGATYVVLASTNLKDWTPIATNVALTGSVVFTDTNSINYSQRLYQVMVP